MALPLPSELHQIVSQCAGISDILLAQAAIARWTAEAARPPESGQLGLEHWHTTRAWLIHALNTLTNVGSQLGNLHTLERREISPAIRHFATDCRVRTPAFARLPPSISDPDLMYRLQLTTGRLLAIHCTERFLALAPGNLRQQLFNDILCNLAEEPLLALDVASRYPDLLAAARPLKPQSGHDYAHRYGATVARAFNQEAAAFYPIVVELNTLRVNADITIVTLMLGRFANGGALQPVVAAVDRIVNFLSGAELYPAPERDIWNLEDVTSNMRSILHAVISHGPFLVCDTGPNSFSISRLPAIPRHKPRLLFVAWGPSADWIHNPPTVAQIAQYRDNPVYYARDHFRPSASTAALSHYSRVRDSLLRRDRELSLDRSLRECLRLVGRYGLAAAIASSVPPVAKLLGLPNELAAFVGEFLQELASN